MAKLFDLISRCNTDFFSVSTVSVAPSQTKNALRKFDVILEAWLHDEKNGAPEQRGITAERLHRTMRGYAKTWDFA